MTGMLADAFWEGCALGELRIRRCSHCSTLQTFPAPVCAVCRGTDVAWQIVSGSGTVFSLTTVSRAPTDAFRPLVPYTIVLVDLDDGPRMMAHGAPGLAIGDRVRVTFFLNEGRHLPRFVPL